MEGNKGYRRGNDLFVCFPSRTSMKMVPKSILSPARIEKGKDSSGSSRRKGQSSPMFPVLLRRRNSNYETTGEPSSPKVTCIGQVRVKSKQRKRWNSGEENYKKWSHIFDFRKELYEALRSFGAELNCFLPRNGVPPTSPTSKESNCKQSSACGGAAFLKWLMMLQDGEEKHHGKLDPDEKIQGLIDSGKLDSYEKFEEHHDKLEDPYERNKEKVYPDEMGRSFMCGADDEKWAQMNKLEEDDDIGYCRRYRYDDDDYGEGEPICTPPRNALLLMRCRSEPLRVALDSGLWMSHANADKQGKTCIGQSESGDSSEGRPSYSQEEEEEEEEEASSDDEKPRDVQSSEAMESLSPALFVMSCEPELTKLSLEVSKETWVSSRDFFRKCSGSQDGSRRLSKDSSDQEECPADAVEINKIHHEELSSREAFVLRRSKSDPVKFSVKIAPEACLWKRRSLGKPLTINI
eukprot:Gb_08135 [translate_table: standard]